ncbi:hypothetical protein DHW03_03825 [Pedobacter yonginense]|uniref:Viral A-type inclusion protein n=1 Tax=Pedobacter yonginense TaxID=651869 RepID=A0A317ESW4_9SPHI|nr:hypothetical protein [Pedobacter yonginense]PWS28973.1 hypothetical protein DHW03_03825 [Pedobacter yonginense]
MKLRNILAFGLVVMTIASCKTEPDSSAIRTEVLNIHDKVMIDGEKVIKNKMKLDTLLLAEKAKQSPDTTKIVDLISRLNKADENMMDWMHFFKDDFKGKNEDENLAYYKSQMIKIRAVEDGYIQVTKESDSVLKILKASAKTPTSVHKN